MVRGEIQSVALHGINQNIEDDNEEIYDLIANIVHDGDPKDGTYRVHILHTETGTWKEIQVLKGHVIWAYIINI